MGNDESKNKPQDSGSDYEYFYVDHSRPSDNIAYGNRRYRHGNANRYRRGNASMYKPPPVNRNRRTEYYNNSTDSLSTKKNSASGVLKEDVITVQEFLKVDNNSTQQHEKLKNLQESSLYYGANGKKMENSELSEQFKKITEPQNVRVGIGLQTVSLDNKNASDIKVKSLIQNNPINESDSSNDMIYDDSVSKNIDKISVEIAVPSCFAETNVFNCLPEQKLQNSVMENSHMKDNAYSDVQKELLEISFKEKLNIDRKLMSEVPVVLSEKYLNKLSKDTENLIIDNFKNINDFIDCLSKVPINFDTNVAYEIKNLSNKLNKLILSFNNEMVEKDEQKTDFPKLTFNTSDANRQLIEQNGGMEHQCSLHCNFCKSGINRYEDVITHINSKCGKIAENKITSEEKQVVVEDANSKQEVILSSLCDSVKEELIQDKQNDISPLLQKVSLKESVANSCRLKKKDLNTQANENFKINDICVPQTVNVQKKTTVNYGFLMKSIARNRKLESNLKTESMYYACLPCDFVTGQQQEWKIHFLNSIHQNNTGHLKDMNTYHCLICRLCLYGDSATIIEHNMLPEHSAKVISTCMERQKYKFTSSKSNDIVSNLGEIIKDKCSDSSKEYKCNNHERLLKILFDRRYSNIGPRGYYCKPCDNYAYYSESKEELHCYTKKHNQKIYNDPQSCKQFYCDSCHVYLYGDVDILSEHNGIKYHVLMDNTQVIQEKYKSSLMNIPDTTVSSTNDVPDSLTYTRVKQNAEIKNQGNDTRTNEKNVSVLDLLEIQSKLESNCQNGSKHRTNHKNTGQELSHSSKHLENMKNLLFDNGCKMNGYFCSPCDISVQARKEWSVHVKSQAHREKMFRKENAKLKHPKLCYTCKIVFICDDSAFKRHISSVCHQEHFELNEKLKNTIEHQDGNSTVSENENSDNKSESEETEMSSSDNVLDDCFLKNSEGEDNMEDTDNLYEEDNMEDHFNEEEGSVDETDNLNEEDTTSEEDNVEEIDNTDGEDSSDEISSNMSYGLTDDFISDSQSVSSVQSSEQIKYIKQTQRKEKMKQENKRKENKNREDKPKGLHIAGLRQGTTHTQIFHVLRNYGHIEYVDVKFGKRDAALVIYRKGSDIDKIVRDNVPLVVNGCKLKIIDTIEAGSLPCYEEDHVLPDTVTKFLKSKGSVHKFMDGLLKTMEDCSIVEQQKVALVVNDIKKLLPSCFVHPYGSRVTGVATRTSDLDLYIDIGGKMYNGDNNQRPEQQAALIELLSDHFSSQHANEAFSDMQRITGARIPIIKLKHNLSGLNCDISCINGLSVENTKLISVYLQLDKRIKWLIIAVKTWASEVKLVDMTMFPSYALIWLVLFFLMQLKTPLVCSVSDLRSKNIGPRQFIAGWDCTFCNNPDLVPPSRNTESCVELLHKFFEFYATFPFRKYVLCPLIGKPLHRGEFNTISKLPSQMKTYVTKVKNNPYVYTLQINTPMCLQDPFDLSLNIVKRVRGHVFKKFVTLCKESAQLCEKWK